MATILAKVSEDGTLTRIRTLNPTGVNGRKGHLAKKTVARWQVAGEKGQRRNCSPYQARAWGSGNGVLADSGIQFTESPENGNVRPGFSAATKYHRPYYQFGTLEEPECDLHLADPEVPSDPEPRPTVHRSGYHLTVPDTSWPEIQRQIAADLKLHRIEMARKHRAAKAHNK
jgi:hypothetical protein